MQRAATEQSGAEEPGGSRREREEGIINVNACFPPILHAVDDGEGEGLRDKSRK
jgi:hypothetical protein